MKSSHAQNQARESASAGAAGTGRSGSSARGQGRVVRYDSAQAMPMSLSLLLQLDVPAVVLTLLGCLVLVGEDLTINYSVLAAVGAMLASRIVTPPDLRGTLVSGKVPPFLTMRLLVEWGTVVAILLAAAFAFKISAIFSRRVLFAWFALTPLVLTVVHRLQAHAALLLNREGKLASKYLIVGANSVGFELTNRMRTNAFLGFFDFRSAERIAAEAPEVSLVGHCGSVADFVRENGVSAVYVALPLANAPRIKQLLNDLRDTTASVYFVPDVFAFDLIQARIVDVNGMPALAICDTPLHGADGASKRLTDVVLAGLGLLVLAPVFGVIALSIKLTSPGPVFFKQRRYGLEGEEILVYKFRSMKVLEDGPNVRQASKDDDRITPIGRFLRRSSLDELPQLINVLEGKMSLVGPRPHAVAHNELYRKLISGYMIRHKVRPGITGWAQVHGLRGETETIDKMEQRVHYDLDYLSHWSWWLDMRILVRTVRLVLSGENAH